MAIPPSPVQGSRTVRTGRRSPVRPDPAHRVGHPPHPALGAARARRVLVVGAVLVALVHKPSQAERASDLRGFLSDVNYDIESCAAGVGESLTALREIQSGASRDVQTAISIANQGASQLLAREQRADRRPGAATR